MITLKKLNDIKIKPVKIEQNKLPVKGECMFAEPYSSIFICSRKKTGKSTVIFNIIKNCISKKTKVLLFCSTVYRDKTWLAIRKYLKKKKIEYKAHTSIKDDNALDEFMNSIKINENDEGSETEEELPKQKTKFISVNDSESEEEEKKPKKEKQLVPDYLLIFDDLSGELKDRKINDLLKIMRHMKMKMIVSSQWPVDIMPEARRQMDYFLLFKGHNSEKLQTLYTDADLNIDFELFKKIYDNATKDKYGFLMIDAINGTLRKGFNKLYEIAEN